MEIVIDVSNIETSLQLHRLLKEKLGFPDFYGNNWDAFWDAITGLVMMPDKLTFVGLGNLEKKLPWDSDIMKKMLIRFYMNHSLWYGDDLKNILVGIDVEKEIREGQLDTIKRVPFQEVQKRRRKQK